MAENKIKKYTELEQAIKQNPGPYVGYVKNPTDVNRMGRLFVHIPDLHSTYDDKNPSAHTVACSYCSPFAGQTPLRDTNSVIEFANTQKSYGFWMVPPDIDTKVLVMFANGNPNQAFWIGCVYEDFMNHMTPGIAVSEPSKFVGTAEENEEYYITRGLEQVPVAEAQRKAASENIARINQKARDDTAFRIRPAHTPSTQTLIAQGLIKDDVRGTTTSSARRETPSQVFGISTPGPIDFAGQQTAKQNAINRHGKIYGNSGDEFDFSKVAHSRLGGNTFVMDDGTPVLREGTTNATEIQNELIRLRTRSGAQLLLHNTEGLAYIINNDGTAWIEFSKDGKIDIYAKDSVSVHTDNDFNLRAERDVNIEAGRNVNIKATGQNNPGVDSLGAPVSGGEQINTLDDIITGRVQIESHTDIQMYAGKDINQKAENDYKLFAMANGKIEAVSNIEMFAKVDFSVTASNTTNIKSAHHKETANQIDMNGPPAAEVLEEHVSATTVERLSTFSNVGVNQEQSIMKRVPTQEPYAEHENLRRDPDTGESFTDQIKTDRERLDEREIE